MTMTDYSSQQKVLKILIECLRRDEEEENRRMSRYEEAMKRARQQKEEGRA